MNRRNFLNTIAIGSAAMAFLNSTASAQVTPKPPVNTPPSAKPLKVNIEISNNHGHAGLISYEAVIVGNKLIADIKGTSSHPHTVILTEEDLTVLRRTRVVEVKSSVDSGHSHLVKITRDLITT